MESKEELTVAKGIKMAYLAPDKGEESADQQVCEGMNDSLCTRSTVNVSVCCKEACLIEINRHQTF